MRYFTTVIHLSDNEEQKKRNINSGRSRDSKREKNEIENKRENSKQMRRKICTSMYASIGTYISISDYAVIILKIFLNTFNHRNSSYKNFDQHIYSFVARSTIVFLFFHLFRYNSLRCSFFSSLWQLVYYNMKSVDLKFGRIPSNRFPLACVYVLFTCDIRMRYTYSW